MDTIKELIKLRDYLEIEMDNNSDEVNTAYRDVYSKINNILEGIKKTSKLI